MMNFTALPLLRKVPSGAILAVLIGLLGWTCHALLFSTFMVYDDEGYVLLSLRNYAEYGQLYDQVYSQYGPGFFVLYDILARVLRFAWTNETARWLNFVLWLGSASWMGLLLHRLTRQLWAAALGFTATVAYLWIMISEPSHPGGLIGFVVAAAAWAGSRNDPARHPATAALLGGLGILMLLTKINVGVFFLTSAGGWLLAHGLTGAPRRLAVGAVTAWAGIMPIMLMFSLVEEDWVRAYMVIASLSSLGVWLVVVRDGTASPAHRCFTAMIGTAALVGVGIGVITLFRGSTLAGLWQGVIVGPLGHSHLYSFSFVWLPGAAPFAILTLLFVGLRSRLPETIANRLIIAVRLIGMLGIVAAFLGYFVRSSPAFGMSYGPALAVWCALSLSGTDPHAPTARTRRWLAWLLVGQFLHGFPVAGSQINWATFLVLPLLVLAGYEVWPRLIRPGRAGALMPPVAVLAGIALTFIIAGKLFATGRSFRANGSYLNLPGAEQLYVTEEIVYAQRSLTRTAATQGDMLFSLPGCFSFNLWTQLPTPTLANSTHWFRSLDQDQQQAIVDRLDSARAPMLVVQQDVLQLLSDSGFSVACPLTDYLRTNFVPVYSMDGYALWARPGQTVIPREVAFRRDNQVELHVETLAAPVSRLDWWMLLPGQRAYLGSLATGSAPLTATPLLHPATPPVDAWSTQLPSGPLRLDLAAVPPAIPPDARLLVVLVGADDRRLTTLRVLP